MRRFCILIGLSVVLYACTSRSVHYLQDSLGKATQADITHKWGPPDETIPLDSGEMWVYRFHHSDSMEHPISCEGFELRFDRDTILRQWTEVDC